MNQEPDSEEWHALGLVVRFAPDRLAAVRRGLAAIPGAEIHVSSPGGKLVLTLEGPSSAGLLEHVVAINHLPGVLSAVLVYQHCEHGPGLDEEIAWNTGSPDACS